MKTLYLILIICFFATGCKDKAKPTSQLSGVGRETAGNVSFQWKDSEIIVNETLLEKKGLTVKTRTLPDPNSRQDTLYKGVVFADLLKLVKNELAIDQDIVEVQFIALDGYVLRVKPHELENRQVFYVLRTPELNDFKIRNLSLNVNFDWRPGYVLLPRFENKKGSTSPYQVKTVKLLDTVGENPILAAAGEEQIAGAKIFVKSCSKCHSHFGFGGFKAPKIELMTIRYPNDSALMKFLRAPSQTLGRPIGMSAFEGSDEQMASLVQYLRTLEQ